MLRRLLPTRSSEPRHDVLGTRWHSLLGAATDAWPLAPALIAPAEFRKRFDGEVVAAVFHHARLDTVAALIDAPFAMTLAARALGSDEDDARRSTGGRAFTPAYEGALAMLCARAAALVCAPSSPPVVRSVTDRVTDITEAIATDSLVLWPWRVTVGLDAGDVNLVLDARTCSRLNQPTTRSIVGMGALQIRVELLAARAHLAAHTVAAIAVGDVIALEGAINLTDDELRGEALLTAGECEIPVMLGVNGIAVASVARARRTGMTNSESKPSAAVQPGADEATRPTAVRGEMLASLPVEVDVVIGHAAFSVGEVSAWRVGEVIPFPSRIGDAVVVRAGGRAIGRGELCDVDGEVGVRITELL